MDRYIQMRLKKKYTESNSIKKNKYTPRTGPKCCNANCGSSRKKRAKAHKRVITAA